MDKKMIIGIGVVVLVIVLAGGYFLTKDGSVSQPSPTPVVEAVSETGGEKTFVVDGSNYAFEPAEIRVKKGDMVKITFKDKAGSHNLVVDGYGVSTRTISGGDEETLSFTADKAGTFEYYCSVGTHRELGMLGKLIVE